MQVSSDDHLTPYSTWLRRTIAPLNRFFDWLYSSKFNPLYRSGTLAVGLLLILLVTGFYLIFFYSVSQPYSSIQKIQEQFYFGRWVRAVHRYATDAAIIATIFHVLQLLVHGKTWGPRILAWISGVILMGGLFLSAWSGYVMVWDLHGQLLAIKGAEMLQVLPFLRETLGVAFSGSVPATQSFFFMNLFLHVGIPLGMLLGLWVHTVRLARSVWLPSSRILVFMTFSLILLGILWPAVLLPEADLLKIVGRISIDWFTGFWLPLHDSLSPKWSLVSLVIIPLALISILFWWRPQKRPSASVVNQDLCSGCTQCARDCPYEAITMIPHETGKRLKAIVSPEICVSCGICVASCDDLAVGPPGRDGPNQHKLISQLCETISVQPGKTVVVACKHNGTMVSRLRERLSQYGVSDLLPVDCCGTLLSSSIEKIITKTDGLLIAACPEGNCLNRDGFELLRQRIFEKRVPFLSRKVDRNRIVLTCNADGEFDQVASAWENINRKVTSNESSSSSSKSGWILSIFRATIATAIILCGIAAFSQANYGSDPDFAIIRVNGMLSGRSLDKCRPLTEQEKLTIPFHMQKNEICEGVLHDYKLYIYANGILLVEEEFKHSGIRGDNPIYISSDTRIKPGSNFLKIELKPISSLPDIEQPISFERQINIVAGRIHLIEYDKTKRKFIENFSNS